MTGFYSCGIFELELFVSVDKNLCPNSALALNTVFLPEDQIVRLVGPPLQRETAASHMMLGPSPGQEGL